MNWVDDLKVALASVAGLGNWMLQVDLLLKISISLVSRRLYTSDHAEDLTPLNTVVNLLGVRKIN